MSGSHWPTRSWARRYGAAVGVTSGVSLRLYDLRHARAKLCARADAQLLISTREVRLHRLRTHEEGGRHLAIRQPLRGELGDAALALRWVPGVRRRPMRSSSARVRSAHKRAPRSSKI